jgi:hypothetical protein
MRLYITLKNEWKTFGCLLKIPLREKGMRQENNFKRTMRKKNLKLLPTHTLLGP